MTYVIAFAERGVTLIAVPAGRYRLVSWRTARTTKLIPADSAFGQPFELLPAQVTLLGHWFAYAKHGVHEFYYSIVPSQIPLSEEVEAFQTTYPSFAHRRIQCLGCEPW
ncbi:MAG TPA: hypothetical protein VFP84_08760 [Kofleriaceae bacterium]|nr:hypothetical protein [Kofleriaceae bacterium]